MTKEEATLLKSLNLRPTQINLAGADPDPERYFAPADRLLAPDPSRPDEVRFMSDGLRLAGHLYRPPAAGEADPTRASRAAATTLPRSSPTT
jgi:hypothetical protein